MMSDARGRIQYFLNNDKNLHSKSKMDEQRHPTQY